MTSPDVLLSFSAADDDCGNARYGFVSACAAHLERRLRDAGAAVSTPRRPRRSDAPHPAALVVFASGNYFADTTCANQWHAYQSAKQSNGDDSMQQRTESSVVVIDLVDDWSGVQSLASGAHASASSLHCAHPDMRRSDPAGGMDEEFCPTTWVAALQRLNHVGSGEFAVFKKEYDAISDGAHVLPVGAYQHLDRIADDLITLLNSQGDAPLSPTNVRAVTPHWADRPGLMTQLKRSVLGPSDHGSIAVLHGLGGMGKTELAVAFAHAYCQEFPAGRWLVPCTGFTDVNAALAQLAEDPRFDIDPAAPQPDILVMTELMQRHQSAVTGSDSATTDPSGSVSTLLVLDDATDASLTESAKTLVTEHPWLTVIVTSRTPYDGSKPHAFHAFDVTELDETTSRELLESFVPQRRGSARHGIEQVVDLLRGYPLSLEQAGVFISDGHGSYADYASLLQSDLAADDASTEPSDALAERIQHHQEMLSTVINSTISSLQVSNPIAADLIRFAALLPQHHVYWPFVRAAMTAHRRTPCTEGDWLTAQQEVINRRLIAQPHPANPSGVMHRLIQASITCNDVGSYASNLEGALPEPTCHDWHSTYSHRLVMLGVLAEQCESVTDTIACGATPEPSLCVALSHALLHVATRCPPSTLKHPERHAPSQQVSPEKADSPAEPLNPDHFYEPSEQFSLAEWFGANVLCHHIFLDSLARYVPTSRLTATLDAVIPTLHSQCDHHPADADTRRFLGCALLDQASLLKDSDSTRATVLIKEATRIGDMLVNEDPYDPECLAFLATALDVHAYLLRFVDETAVKAVNQRAVQVRQQLVEADPDCLEYHNLLATTFGNHAQIVRSTDTHHSDSLNDEALAIRRSLVAAAPDDAEYQHRLANLLTSYAASLLHTSAEGRCRPMCEEAVGILRSLHHQDADNVEYRMRLAATLGIQAKVLKSSSPAQAADSYQEATLHAEHIAVREPTNQQFRLILARLLSQQAGLASKTDTQRAISLYQRSERLLNLLVEEAPEKEIFKKERTAVQERLSKCLQN